MPTKTPRMVLERRYQKAAQEYQRNLPLEHYMEATPHATQRRITLASLELLEAKRTDVHLFNELLVQYRLPKDHLGQVVPDNMVVIHPDPIDADGSYVVELQPAGPFWVLEYVSKSTKRKDYKDNMQKYERDLKVPYYLLFDPETQKLALYRHNKKRYVAVVADAPGRCSIKELDIEVGLLDGWVRFWYQGELLPLPTELQDALDETKRQLTEMTRRAATATRRADTAARRADTATQRADTATQRAETEALRAEALERENAELRAQLKKSEE